MDIRNAIWQPEQSTHWVIWNGRVKLQINLNVVSIHVVSDVMSTQDIADRTDVHGKCLAADN